MICSRSADAFRERPPAAYTVMGKRRLPVDAEGIIDWHIHNWIDDIAPYHQVGVFANAFNEWQQHLFPWQFRSTSDPGRADWHIRVAKDNKIQIGSDLVDSPYDFRAAPNVLAVQYEYYPGFRWSLTMIINDDHEFGLGNGHSYEFAKVVLHECAHGLRLGHTDVPGNDIMSPTYDVNNIITLDSINGLTAIHRDHLAEYATTLDRSKRFISIYAQGLSEKPKRRCKLFA